jgi:predicted RNA-binding protein with PUA-like domain
VVVEMVPENKLSLPVSLEMIKKDERLENIALLKQSRLSVMPLKREEFDAIIQLSERS